MDDERLTELWQAGARFPGGISHEQHLEEQPPPASLAELLVRHPDLRRGDLFGKPRSPAYRRT
jgi:hypothetical protein